MSHPPKLTPRNAMIGPAPRAVRMLGPLVCRKGSTPEHSDTDEAPPASGDSVRASVCASCDGWDGASATPSPWVAFVEGSRLWSAYPASADPWSAPALPNDEHEIEPSQPVPMIERRAATPQRFAARLSDTCGVGSFACGFMGPGLGSG